ncbi:hypothetical protein TL16_g12645 [Triparma laevis f. inornata]|uniref:Uncharacterized protein n=1 Tax=Triparma laevis f. inornata TaxID=1714386 RepID=A0A9W7BW72_9STRA|nr:hypothetical protein TL16_g12645 [Triparma laevis f. inornata]
MNISHKAIDTHPLYRSVDVNLLLSSDSKLENSKPTDKWVLDVRKLWKKVITQFIETGEVVPQTTTNSKTGQTHEKWRLRCKPLNSETGSVMLFSPEKVKENCEGETALIL